MEQAQNLLASSTKDALGAMTNMSFDTIILIVLFVTFFAYGLKLGKRRIISLILSFYISIPVASSFPYLEKISFFGDTEKAMLYSQIGLFILIIIFINVAISGAISFELGSHGLRRLFETGALAVASGGLLVAISYHAIKLNSLYDFAAPIDSLFASTAMLFWWLVLPLVTIFFAIRR